MDTCYRRAKQTACIQLERKKRDVVRLDIGSFQMGKHFGSGMDRADSLGVRADSLEVRADRLEVRADVLHERNHVFVSVEEKG